MKKEVTQKKDVDKNFFKTFVKNNLQIVTGESSTIVKESDSVHNKEEDREYSLSEMEETDVIGVENNFNKNNNKELENKSYISQKPQSRINLINKSLLATEKNHSKTSNFLKRIEEKKKNELSEKENCNGCKISETSTTTNPHNNNNIHTSSEEPSNVIEDSDAAYSDGESEALVVSGVESPVTEDDEVSLQHLIESKKPRLQESSRQIIAKTPSTDLAKNRSHSPTNSSK